MLKVDSSLNHIPAGRNHVIGLHESINQPLVNIPTYGTAPTGAYVMGTRNDQGAYTVFVYLHQPDTKSVVIYVSEPRHLSHEQYRVEEAEALRFVESMGFMVDNLHFPTLAPPEQETVMGRIPLFRPPQPTLDLYDVEDERGAPEPRPQTAPLPQTAPQGLAGIFGGLSPQDSALFRANRGHPAPAVIGTPATPPVRAAATAVPLDAIGPVDGPQTSVDGESAVPAGFVAAPPASPAPAASASPVASGPRPTAPASTFASGPPVVTGQPVSSSPSVDPDVLQRLGRLLGTFVWLLAALGGGAGCKSSGTPEPERSTTAQLDLGNQQLAQGQWADAIKAFSRALEEDEENFDALRGTGLAYLKLGRLEDAERFYERSLEANPKSSLSRNELGVVYVEQRRCQKAVPLFEKVLEDIYYATPEYAEHNLARAFVCLGKVDRAIARLDKLVTKRPYFCLGYLTLSRLASKSRRPELTIRACDDFAHYCEQNEKIKDQVLPQQSALCYLRKGLAYAEMGDVESARASFERCQSLGEVGRECTKSLELLPQ